MGDETSQHPDLDALRFEFSERDDDRSQARRHAGRHMVR